MKTPLNQQLYQALLSAVRIGFASGGLAGNTVKITKHGIAPTFSYTPDPVLGGQLRMNIIEWGETYQVCCPFCNDHRYRLNIPSFWGVPDPKTGLQNLRSLTCFNERCTSVDETAAKNLQRRLNAYRRQVQLGEVTIAEGYKPQRKRPRNPGECVRLDQVDSQHAVHRYLLSRGHNPDLLGQSFGLSYCLSSHTKFAADRLIFPIYLDGESQGWQARYIGPNADGNVNGLFRCDDCRSQWHDLSHGQKGLSPAKPSRPMVCPNCHSVGAIHIVPKYFTCPGMTASRCMFNYDVARKWPFGVIVEGAMDVCRVGVPEGADRPGPAVAIQGHWMSPDQIDMATSAWRDGGLILLLDPDAHAAQTRLVQSLGKNFRYVLPVALHNNCDPGDCSNDEIWKLIRETARTKGVRLEGI